MSPALLCPAPMMYFWPDAKPRSFSFSEGFWAGGFSTLDGFCMAYSWDENGIGMGYYSEWVTEW